MAVTLLERVQRSAAPQVEQSEKTLTVEDLREAVKRYLAFESVAQLVEENPSRARNELRSACRQVFAEPQWRAMSPPEREHMTQELVSIVFGMGPLEALLSRAARCG